MSKPLPVVSLENVSVTKPRRIGGVNTAILKSISLSIAPGEILGVIGESGSGKTTLARVIAGLEDSTGTLRFKGHGRETHTLKAWRHQVSRGVRMLFQHPDLSLNPGRTVLQSMAQAYRIHQPDVEDVDAEATELLTRLGLPKTLLHRKPGGLSGGEKRRVAFARAVATRPELLICDEATSGLDVAWQRELLKFLLELKHQLDLTLMMITHDLRLAAAVCDRVCILRAGELLETALRHEISTGTLKTPYGRELLAASLDIGAVAKAKGWELSRAS